MKRFLLFLFVVLSLTSALTGYSPDSVEPQIVEDVRSIVKAQVIYAATKGRGKATDLNTLGKEGLIDSTLSSGEKWGYIFTTEVIGQDGRMFDVTAKPKNEGGHSFYSNEMLLYIVYEVEGGEPPVATIRDRIPMRGRPVNGIP